MALRLGLDEGDEERGGGAFAEARAGTAAPAADHEEAEDEQHRTTIFFFFFNFIKNGIFHKRTQIIIIHFLPSSFSPIPNG
jgi:hypothetical protein